MTYSLIAITLGLAALAFFQLSKIGRRPKDYPPGPPTLPLIGNLHQMPGKNGHLQFQKWAQEYGPVYSLILGTKVMIVLSSDQSIKDLLDKRSNIYSSRPEMYLGQIVSGYLRVLLMEYGDTWRMIRKMIHNILNIKAAKSYVPYQDLENKQMLLGLLEQPELFVGHIRRYTNSLTTQMVFGFRTISIDDPKLIQLFHGFEKFCEVTATTTAALLDLFPILKVLPDFMLPLRAYSKELHKRERELYVGHWMNVKEKIKTGVAKPCFCVDLVKAQDVEGFSDALAGYISGSLLEAGSDTTAATLIGFVQAMVVFPGVQRKAQEEIDRVCGERYPTMDDERDLQYIRGCVKESMRWMPTDILGVPHAVIKDDEYMGYKIPKGAGVMWNVWAIHMDPKRHLNPRAFDPSRYANDFQTASEAASNSDASKRDHFVFGAGRRLCQGMHIAERSLFLGISRMLWAFNFEKARDEEGKEIIPDIDKLTEGLFVFPQPFPAKISPRSEKHARKIREEWASAQELLDEQKQWKEVPKGMVFSTYTPDIEAKH
ncbi:cytochrome P450 [Mollisia scopiformis]|uniref:Cytochrome P450 n=1 Tax=Mollisia scopiformis TaxID=149040 RepID=A0A132BB66_MOLSC|nr:cytochrome P450 [Mollisia scopiformis]KUJ09662.1 cytochrome P450 [Mollisia scopiformis]